MLDLIIKNGLVFDGDGTAPVHRDIGIENVPGFTDTGAHVGKYKQDIQQRLDTLYNYSVISHKDTSRDAINRVSLN